MSKLASMHDAIAALVRDGDTVAIEGFTHLISFAAGHEIIRQGRRNLTLCRLTPDLIYDQMIAAGCARKLVFSWAGNPGAGSLHAFRRAVEQTGEIALELEEYSHFGMVARFSAGAAGLPFWPMRDYTGTDLPRANPEIRSVTCPYTGEVLATVPALNPDVTIVHAQRADADGNTQLWGLVGVQKEAAFAARRVIVVVEELVESSAVRADPNRTLIPGSIVDAMVVEPWGAHPSYVYDYYDRDNDFYVAWEAISRDPERLARWLQEYVYGVRSRGEYMAKVRSGRYRSSLGV
jgi:glutaconate CoA-transferase subunit A